MIVVAWRRLALSRTPSRDGRAGAPGVFDPARALCLMHVPKTAGTAIKIAIAESLGVADPVYGLDLSLFGTFSDFASMAPEERRQIYADGAAIPASAPLILGHFSYPTLRAARPEGQIFSILREPFSRLLSHWLYWRQQTEERLRAAGGWADFVRAGQRPLADFLDEQRLAPQTDNAVLRMLLSDHPGLRPDRFIAAEDDRALLAAAQARLHDLSFVDIVENPAFLSNLQTWLGRPIPLRRLNETPPMPAERRAPLHRELTPRACTLLTARSRLDLKLWESIARRSDPGGDIAAMRQAVLMRNMARYGALMAD